MNCTKGKWFYKNGVIENGNHVICEMNRIGDRVDADAHLIAAAVNACVKVNPDNPMAAAESLPALYEALNRLTKETRPYAYQGMLDEADKALAEADSKE